MRRALAKFCYALLVLAGVAFTVTACGYAVLAVRSSPQYRRAVAGQPRSPVAEFFSRNGERLLAAELVVLIGASVSAVAAHGKWRTRRTKSDAHAAFVAGGQWRGAESNEWQPETFGAWAIAAHDRAARTADPPQACGEHPREETPGREHVPF